MKAVVMAGGEGTRLRPLTSNQPKPMVPIAGKPCIEHILELVRRHGIDEAVITLAFMPQAIRTYLGDGEALGMTIDYSVEEQPLGTAGSVRLAHGRLDETFVVISGDALCDVDLRALIAAHREKGAAVTIGLKSVDNPLEFGIVVTDDDGRVERFLEKPSWGQVFSDTINTGIYVLEPEVLRHVPTDRPYDFSKELFPLLLEMGRPIHGHVLDGYWQDIGTIEQFRQANFDALDERVALEIAGIKLRGNVWVGEGVDMPDLDHVQGPAFIGNNCRIAGDATVGPYAVLASGVTLRERAGVSRSILDASTYIGRNTVVDGAIVGRSCDLRDRVRVHEGVAIGDEVTIGSEAVVMPGVRIYPFKRVESGTQIHEHVVWESTASSRLFARDGLTGRVNVDLTPEVAVRIAAALGTALEQGARVVASRDAPDACRMVQRAMIAGLTSTGARVADLRMSPAAITRHVLKTQGLVAGVHVGQSQSDPEQVEIRIFEAPGIQLTGSLQREIERYFTRRELRRVGFSEVAETTYPARVRESYAQDILDGLDRDVVRARAFRLAVDYGHSAGSFTLPLVLGPIGVEAVSVHGFFGHDTDLTAPLDEAKRLVTAVAADVGAVFDRAAERLFLIDEHGATVSPETTVLLFVRLLAEAGRAGAIAAPVSATRQIEALVEGSSLHVVRTRNSLSALTRAAAEHGVVFAAATSGGYVFPDVVPGYDAVAALCKLLELLAGVEQPLSELVASLPEPTLRTTSVECPWSRKGLVMRVLNEQLSHRTLDLLDGVKATDDRGWVLAIPDADEPLVHVFAEGTSALESELLGAEVRALVEAAVQGDDSPQRTGAAATSS